MNAMLEPRMVVARIQPPFAAGVSSCGPARIRASSQGGLAILAINHGSYILDTDMGCHRAVSNFKFSFLILSFGSPFADFIQETFLPTYYFIDFIIQQLNKGRFISNHAGDFRR